MRVAVGLVALAVIAGAFVRVGGGSPRTDVAKGPAAPSAPSTEPPAQRSPRAPGNPPLDLLFVHHSVGAQLLADPGPDDPARGTHPNGGGLRRALTAAGYRVHEATYGSRLGEHTDLFDWSDKFSGHMDELLATDQQDAALPPGVKNRIVLFKSCFPNSWFVGAGTPPGDPRGPLLTEANARAALGALLPVFARHPDTLFVYLTAPPLAPVAPGERLYRWVAKKLLGKPTAKEKLSIAGESARRFDGWVVAKDGWLSGYPGNNVAVFDYFDVLTRSSPSGLSGYPTDDGTNSHPSSAGNLRATTLLVPFLEEAVERSGLRAGASPAPGPTPSGHP